MLFKAAAVSVNLLNCGPSWKLYIQKAGSGAWKSVLCVLAAKSPHGRNVGEKILKCLRLCKFFLRRD